MLTLNYPEHILNNVQTALHEDIGTADLTALLLPEHQTSCARVITRQDAVLCGTQWFEACFKLLQADCEIQWFAQDGDFVHVGQTLCEITGKTRTLLTAERCGLNFLQTLSATATATRRYVDIVAGTSVKILDTRKTLPGLRLAQKYAVKMGGGDNQRIGLFDGILIKENHITAAGSIQAVMQQAFNLIPAHATLQIEVETLEQLEQALDAGAKLILLDNFSLEQMRQAVQITNKRAELEASGGITLDTIRKIAETGVDRISIGSLSKDIQAIDLSMRMINTDSES